MPEVVVGDCLDVLRGMEGNSVDAMVTDPPAGIAFMSMDWDKDKGGRTAWVAWLTEVMEEALRVVKPGGHAFVWALPRTSHWTALALEDAGWEIRDRIAHHFGSGFPKSANVSKLLDKMAGAERAVVGKLDRLDQSSKPCHKNGYSGPMRPQDEALDVTAPATEEAKQWEGWGTALKPATEDWWLARKPLSESSVARNVLLHGTGAINVDASRVGWDTSGLANDTKRRQSPRTDITNGSYIGSRATQYEGEKASPQGRWPANLLLSHASECNGECVENCPVRLLDEQSGVSKSPNPYSYNGKQSGGHTNSDIGNGLSHDKEFGHKGGASRFFKCFEGEHADTRRDITANPDSTGSYMDELDGVGDSSGGLEPDTGDGFLYQAKASRAERTCDGTVECSHPTVKPIALMRYLVKMITPSGGTCLDPFMGSGSTGCAAILEGFDFIGIERDESYAEIAEKRIAHYQEQAEDKLFA